MPTADGMAASVLLSEVNDGIVFAAFPSLLPLTVGCIRSAVHSLLGGGIVGASPQASRLQGGVGPIASRPRPGD